MSLQPYKKYYPVSYDYVQSLPDGWKLLPNIAIFEERIERQKGDFELLSISISKGVVRQSDMDKKDISSPDKSNYKIVRNGDIAYGMEFRKGAVGFSQYEGIVSPVYTVLKPRKKTQLIQSFFIMYLELNIIKIIFGEMYMELVNTFYLAVSLTSRECIALFRLWNFKIASWNI